MLISSHYMSMQSHRACVHSTLIVQENLKSILNSFSLLWIRFVDVHCSASIIYVIGIAGLIKDRTILLKSSKELSLIE